ncbi:MAG: hypothetical protein HOP19_07590 [Acidobacteria bacterium]|nr:hypothetical protein [Acidobacteriota bacterium]
MNSFLGISHNLIPRTQRWEASLSRTFFVVAVLVLSLGLTGCARLAKVSDTSIPRMVAQVASADFNQLLVQLKPFTDVQGMRASRIGLRFIEPQAETRWRDADAIVVLQRPDRIRVVIQIPVTKSRIAEMVSEANRFKVAVYQERPSFILGTNDADYTRWRERLGKDKQSALANARPFHFTDALLMRPLHAGENGYAYSVEEQLQEETETKPNQKTATRVLRSYYVMSELKLGENGLAQTLRRFWFDRTDNLQLRRQQLFDGRGGLVTEVTYSNYQKLGEANAATLPTVVLVSRPHDGYGARFSFSPENFELNPELPQTAFVLENKENLPETDLDKPVK